jgi:hypothetical protein
VREGLLLPGKLIGRRPAHTPPPPPDLFKPAAPPSFSVPESATTMSFLPAKNLIFLQDSQNDFKFLVETGAFFSILPHSSLAPPIGPHLVGANDKQIPIWGFRHRNVCFSGQNFVFDFFTGGRCYPSPRHGFLSKI